MGRRNKYKYNKRPVSPLKQVNDQSKLLPDSESWYSKMIKIIYTPPEPKQ